MDTLGERVYRLRIEKGWSQKVLALEADTSQSAVSMIEKGEFEPSRELLKRLSFALEVSTDLILFGAAQLKGSDQPADFKKTEVPA